MSLKLEFKKFKPCIKERVIRVAHYFIDNRSTIRETADQFKISKSTVHFDLTKRLPYISLTLYIQVRGIILTNIDERASRGGRGRWKSRKSRSLIQRRVRDGNWIA